MNVVVPAEYVPPVTLMSVGKFWYVVAEIVFTFKVPFNIACDPSKVKLKELVRKMMKEMFDGRDNVTDVTGENN